MSNDKMVQFRQENANAVKQARETLAKAGYAVESLWQVADVQSLFDCSEEDALYIMNKSLQNDCTMNNTWEVIDIVAVNRLKMNWSRKQTGATGANSPQSPVFIDCSSYFGQLEHNWSNWSSCSSCSSCRYSLFWC